MTDLDIGMNTRLCEPFVWDNTQVYDRGKVMTREDLDSGKDFGRYLDVDGDGIPYRTYPGVHPTRGAYFTRGTTKDRYARYSEAGPDYVDNMQRLLRKHNTAKELLPKPLLKPAARPARYGAIYYGSTSAAMNEALDVLGERGVHINALRVRGFPFQEEIADFVAAHPWVFVVEQNRDGQLKQLLVNEAKVNAARLIPVLHYDGTPITARFIVDQVCQHTGRRTVVPIKKAVS